MATRQDIDKLSKTLANYLESKSAKNWDIWIKEFTKAPLTKAEYALVTNTAREIIKGYDSPVMRELVRDV